MPTSPLHLPFPSGGRRLHLLYKPDSGPPFLQNLMDGPKGFDLSRNLWKMSGWKQLEKLRKQLENLRELRDLVRQLGRGGGRGPRRRAPREVGGQKHHASASRRSRSGKLRFANTRLVLHQVEMSGKPPGMVRSPLQPEETSGLARSGDLSLMLPAEQALVAKGWPRMVWLKCIPAGRPLPVCPSATDTLGLDTEQSVLHWLGFSDLCEQPPARPFMRGCFASVCALVRRRGKAS